jgi:hypothetical protein
VTVACGATYVTGGIVWSVLKRWMKLPAHGEHS